MLMSSKDQTSYLEATYYLDHNTEQVKEFTARHVGHARTDSEKAERLFYAVRDTIPYNPYEIKLVPEHFKASHLLKKGSGFCIPKAILLASVLRSVGIPSRLGFADVKNHLSTKQLLSMMRTDFFVFHGFTEIFLHNKWVKSTPAFNLSLCQKFGVLPLEFDDQEDSIFHPFDKSGQKHMEYIRYRGHFSDLPFDEVIKAWKTYYPHFFH